MGTSERQLPPGVTSRSSSSSVLQSVESADDEAVVWRVRSAAFGVIGALMAGWLFITSAYAAHVQPRGRIEEFTIIDHGLYEPMQGRLPKDVPPYSVNDVQLIGVTDSIPAQLGIKFGFRYRIVGRPFGAPVAVKTVILFPSAGVVSPTEGLLHSFSQVKTDRIGQLKAIAYRIEEPWQLVPGIWTIQLWVGSQKFAEQTFRMMPQRTAMN